MFSSEIRDTLMLSVSLILLASLLSFIMFLFTIRADLAEVRNTEVQAQEVLEQHRKYNSYNNREVYGEDVLAAIRDYYNSELELGVYGSTGNVIYKIDKLKAQQSPNLVEMRYLRGLFFNTGKYNSKLVYGGADIDTVARGGVVNVGTSSNVTGIIFIKE